MRAFANMPQTEEAAMWFAAVYQAVREIPYGKATSYGHIATLIGYRESMLLCRVCDSTRQLIHTLFSRATKVCPPMLLVV